MIRIGLFVQFVFLAVFARCGWPAPISIANAFAAAAFELRDATGATITDERFSRCVVGRRRRFLGDAKCPLAKLYASTLQRDSINATILGGVEIVAGDGATGKIVGRDRRVRFDDRVTFPVGK